MKNERSGKKEKSKKGKMGKRAAEENIEKGKNMWNLEVERRKGEVYGRVVEDGEKREARMEVGRKRRRTCQGERKKLKGERML